MPERGGKGPPGPRKKGRKKGCQASSPTPQRTHTIPAQGRRVHTWNIVLGSCPGWEIRRDLRGAAGELSDTGQGGGRGGRDAALTIFFNSGCILAHLFGKCKYFFARLLKIPNFQDKRRGPHKQKWTFMSRFWGRMYAKGIQRDRNLAGCMPYFACVLKKLRPFTNLSDQGRSVHERRIVHLVLGEN